RLPLSLARLRQRRAERLADLGQRLERARSRMLADSARQLARDRAALDQFAARLAAGATRLLPPRREALERLDRLRQTLGYRETLRRGFAVVHGPAGLLTSAAEAAQTPRFEIEFHDGRMAARPDAPPAKPARKPRQPKGQPSLF
ncbi:exodeoxyribonuclease VII large subunit, partial [Paracoccus simplex]